MEAIIGFETLKFFEHYWASGFKNSNIKSLAWVSGRVLISITALLGFSWWRYVFCKPFHEGMLNICDRAHLKQFKNCPKFNKYFLNATI